MLVHEGEGTFVPQLLYIFGRAGDVEDIAGLQNRVGNRNLLDRMQKTMLRSWLATNLEDINTVLLADVQIHDRTTDGRRRGRDLEAKKIVGQTIFFD